MTAQHKQLVQTLTLLHQEARYAYWKGETHCGSDFTPQGHCRDCQHFVFCKTMHEIDEALETLAHLDGD